jgi:hypothetical protein
MRRRRRCTSKRAAPRRCPVLNWPQVALELRRFYIDTLGKRHHADFKTYLANMQGMLVRHERRWRRGGGASALCARYPA